ncbi:nucleic acid-binding protein, partial [Atractiella rhizophila]
MVRLQLKGTILRAGLMSKTCTVRVPKLRYHPIAGKEYTRHKNYLVHDPEEKGKVGDLVVIEHCRPMSRRKHFKLETILQSATQWV